VLSTRSDIQRLLADLASMRQRRSALTIHARQLDEARHAAELAWQAGLLDWPTYLSVRGNALSADLDLLDLQQQQATQAIALEALLGNTDLATTHSNPAKSLAP
jgi:outer membrane protein, heavy metal efflux system